MVLVESAAPKFLFHSKNCLLPEFFDRLGEPVECGYERRESSVTALQVKQRALIEF
jgi:hypothetical protein